VSDFESGKPSVDLAAVLRLLDVLDISLLAADAGSSAVPASAQTLDLDAHLKDYLGR
jgi:hypothetical protein